MIAPGVDALRIGFLDAAEEECERVGALGGCHGVDVVGHQAEESDKGKAFVAERSGSCKA